MPFQDAKYPGGRVAVGDLLLACDALRRYMDEPPHRTWLEQGKRLDEICDWIVTALCAIEQEQEVKR